MTWKYVVIEVETDSGVVMEMPIIFPDKLTHLDVSNAIQRVIEREMGMMARPVSAAFMDFEDPNCVGRSESMGIGSRPEDVELIEFYGVTHGIKDALPPGMAELIRARKRERKKQT